MGLIKKIAAVIREHYASSKSDSPGKIAQLNQKLKESFEPFISRWKTFYSANPKLVNGIIIAVSILLVGIFIYIYTLPESKKINVTLKTPRLTPLVKNARPDDLLINFAGSAAKLEDIQKEIESGIEISPSKQGIWKWSKDDQISFTPATDWPAGVEYTVEMDDDLFPSHIELETYSISFQTHAFTVSIISNNFHIDPVNEDIKQVAATVVFSHPVDRLSFEENVTLHPDNLNEEIRTFEDRDYNLEIKYDDFFGTAYILSEALPMPADNVIMKLTVEKGVHGLIPGGSSANDINSYVTIPGISSFIKINSVNQTMVRNEEYKLEQILVLNTKGKARGSDLKNNMEVWVLPKDRPKLPGISFSRNHRWSDPAIIGPEILKLSKPVDLEVIETELEFESLNSFKIKVEPEKYIYIKINKGTPFYGKYSLSKEYTRILRVKKFPKQLEIMHDGVILSSSGNKKISLMSQGVEDVQFRIGRVPPDQLNHLVTQTSGDLKNLRFRNYYFDEENIVQNYYETRKLQKGEPGDANYFSFDFTNYLGPKESGRIRNGIFFFEIREWDPVYKRALSLRDKRLIMVSDLGVLVKDGSDSSHDIFVQSISTGQPVNNARVQVLGKNGLPVLSSSTDAAGHLSLPSLNSFTQEKTATVYLISKGNDLSFIPVQASSRWLNYSKFDVGGVHGAWDANKIDGYLFSERGIYRPGDEFNIGMIVKAGNWAKSLAGTPMEVRVTDPRGIEIYKKKFKLSQHGFDEMKYQTEYTSPTGTYQINLYFIKNNKTKIFVASTTVKVEEFLPDRLEISSIFPGVGNRAWVPPDDLTAQVTLRNLFGSPARGNRVVANMSLSPGRMWFRAYKDYRFSDPLSSDKAFQETLPEKFTDDEGKAIFDFNLSRFEAATYRITFSADGFEKESGRNVSTVSSVLVSPLSYLLGTKPNGDLSYIYKNSERTLNVIAINPKLEKMAVSDVKFDLKRIQYVSVLTELPNGTYAYKSVPKKIPVSVTTKNVPKAGLNYPLLTTEPGEYELLIMNSDNVQFSRIFYSVIGKANITRSLDKTAELEIKLNKTDYKPGEDIEIYVKAPYKGAGLITIEQDKIYSYQWFKSTSNSFLKKITVPASLTGNGYVNVAFVRAADSKQIYMSPLSYGIAPFSVSKEDKMNKITIDIPGTARSGKVFPIKYKSAKPGTIVVFAVDEGILQVAEYRTPAPLDHFFKKRALEVRTSQLLDLILPDFKLFRKDGAMGGGMGFEDISKNLNPFRRKQHKPVVYWSGLLKSDSRERTLEYTVPDYFNGTLRVMAVVVSDDAIGTFEEKAIVKNPYIISPNVPMFAAPRDSFLVSVTVTNGVAGSGKRSPVKLSVTGTEHLQVLDGVRNLIIDEDSDTTISLYVKANNYPGGAALNFKASGNKETTELASYLSVRPAIPYQTRVTTGVIQDEAAEVPTPRIMYKDYRLLNASVSFLPLGLSKGLVAYLDRFPHGCTEQVLSQAFPYLYLRDVTGFGIKDRRASQKVNYALKVLQARQNGQGKFGFWAANSYTSDFITVYGMHFITECKKAGYYVPESFFNKTVSALRSIAGSKGNNLRDWRVQAYAIYILTVNEIITTNLIASLRTRMENTEINWEEDLTAAYLAGSYHIMKQNREAGSLFDEVMINPPDTESPWDFCNNFVQDAQILYLLSTHAKDILEDYSARLLSSLAGYLIDRSFSTITSSYTIMALSAYSNAVGEPQGGDISITQILRDSNEEKLRLPPGKFPTVDFSQQAVKLNIDSEDDHHLYYQVIQGGFDTALPEKRISEGIEIFREFTDKSGSIVQNVSIGDEVEVHIKFRSLTGASLYNIAIIDMLPAGLEAVPTSVRANREGSWQPDHTDIREDRLNFYGTVNTEAQEIVYTVRAINKGTFVVPPIYGESMYDRTIYGTSPQEKFIVE
ncbi:alpha-2-macroglobulin [Bacteroidota bacterium]